MHVRKWECAQVGNAQVGRAQKIVRNFFLRKWEEIHFKNPCKNILGFSCCSDIMLLHHGMQSNWIRGFHVDFQRCL